MLQRIRWKKNQFEKSHPAFIFHHAKRSRMIHQFRQKVNNSTHAYVQTKLPPIMHVSVCVSRSLSFTFHCIFVASNYLMKIWVNSGNNALLWVLSFGDLEMGAVVYVKFPVSRYIMNVRPHLHECRASVSVFSCWCLLGHCLTLFWLSQIQNRRLRKRI
jgi:hypothetical protein